MGLREAAHDVGEGGAQGLSQYGLTLFGGFDLRDDRGSPIPVPSKKSRCLLAYLVLAQSQQKHLDALAGLLWGNRVGAAAACRSPKSARRSCGPRDPD